MCRWCVRSEISDRLTAGLAPSRREFLAYAASLAVVAGSGIGAQAAAPLVDVIFHNGPVCPMSAAGAKADAIAISGDTIVAVGSEAEVMALKGAATQVVDLAGRTLLPGLIDLHNHMTLTALFDMLLTDVGFSKYKTKADALAAMKDAAAKAAAGEWLAFSFYDNLLPTRSPPSR